MARGLRVAVCGGATGGHVVPALNICRELKARVPEVEIIYIGARGSLEERLARGEGLPFRRVWTTYLRRGFSPKNVLVPVVAFVSVFQGLWHLVAGRIRLVIATGGYSAWPAVAAAKWAAVPYFLQEQNAYPGLVTKLLARGARRIYLGQVEAGRHLSARPDQMLHTGNPVIVEEVAESRSEARSTLGIDPGRFTVLATGGSGGARSINEAIEAVRGEIIERGYNLIWQVGKQWDAEPVVPEHLIGRMVVARFFDRRRMSLAMSAADLAVARCGAMTLAELALFGLPAILVPYPHATEGHQEANGRAYQSAGAGRMILDRDFNGKMLMETIDNILSKGEIPRMAEAMKGLARPDAARRIVEDILAVVR